MTFKLWIHETVVAGKVRKPGTRNSWRTRTAEPC